MSATSDNPEPSTVVGAAENGGMLSLTVQFDVAGCPDDKSMSTIDFTKMNSDECVQNLYLAVSTDCLSSVLPLFPFPNPKKSPIGSSIHCLSYFLGSQDSTWGDYDPNYTIEGGEFLNDCGLWRMVGEPSS